MSQTVHLPELGESVTEGTVSRWLKSVGDSVAEGDALLEVSTDKVDTEVPSPVAGVLEQILAPQDSTVAVGADLAVIGDGSSIVGDASAAAKDTAPPAVKTEPATTVVAGSEPPAVEIAEPAAPQPDADPDSKLYVTPLVRQLAAEHGLDLATITGTGIGGRIRKEDVLAAVGPVPAASETTAAPAPPAVSVAPKVAPASAPSSVAQPTPGTTEKLSNLRKVVATRLVEAMQTQAQLTTVVEVDVTKLAALRAKTKEAFRAREGVSLTFLPFYVAAATEALKQFPKINASIDVAAGEITYHNSQNVGIAVDTDRGLMVPVIKNAGDMSLAGIAKAIADLAARTRANKVTADELQGGTFTITNTGSGGSLIDTPIVPLGQVAILGTGAITKRPGVIQGPDGEDVIAIRQYAYLFLSYDHRLIDGADAARFLKAVKQRIEAADFAAQIGG